MLCIETDGIVLLIYYYMGLYTCVLVINIHNFYFIDVQTLDTMQALCLPLGASISLLVMFFFFDSMQMLFAICTASKFMSFNNLILNKYI